MATQTHQYFTDRSKSPHNPSQLVSSSPSNKDPAEFAVHTQKTLLFRPTATSFAYYQLRLVVVNDSTMLFILDSSRIQHSLPLEPFLLKDSRQLGLRAALELSAQEWNWT